MKKIILAGILCILCCTACRSKKLVLAAGGRAKYSVVLAEGASVCEKFAAEELCKYLGMMSGANFAVSDSPGSRSIVVTAGESAKKLPVMAAEESGIFVRGNDIYLSGGSDRAVLYAVYDFLRELGCRWVAPEYDFFEGSASNIPQADAIIFAYTEDIVSAPALTYRKFYIEEGLTHDMENLMQLIEWMPKLKFNILACPLNYLGQGKVAWDNWRGELTPELEKRGILIEVGGHGYNNFLNAGMEDGTLFTTHPEWFGMDGNGNRTAGHSYVFCTSNEDAVNYLHSNLLGYLKSHPEIDIFDFWPPDSDRWCECEQCRTSSPSDRHAVLVSRTAELLKKELPELKLECLAYNKYVNPPENETMAKDVLVDFCPISQSFETHLWEPGDANNETYYKGLTQWLSAFDGDISIYSYYRKYIWFSLPNIFPGYMQQDVRHYRDMGAKGISVYSEPGDWFTYGPNYYVLGHLAQDPDADIDRLMREYTEQIYGPWADIALSVYSDFEQVVRFGCRFPQSLQKSMEEYDMYYAVMDSAVGRITDALMSVPEPHTVERAHLGRLLLMTEYARMSILERKADVRDNLRLRGNRVTPEVMELFENNQGKGLFVIRHPYVL